MNNQPDIQQPNTQPLVEGGKAKAPKKASRTAPLNPSIAKADEQGYFGAKLDEHPNSDYTATRARS